MQDLLFWHAVEESEHKSVAFDTFMSIEGDQKYLRWCQVYATLFFFHRIGWYTIKLLWWQKKMPSWKDFKGFWRFMTGKKGMFTGVQKNYFDWFIVGFHPCDHDNADLIDRWKTEFYREDQDIGAQKAKAKAEASAA